MEDWTVKNDPYDSNHFSCTSWTLLINTEELRIQQHCLQQCEKGDIQSLEVKCRWLIKKIKGIHKQFLTSFSKLHSIVLCSFRRQ
jgi:hypothetical protein